VIDGRLIAAAEVQPCKVAMTCCSKGKCFMLKTGEYLARWLGANEIEVTGRREDNGKWQKAQFSVASVLQPLQ
jgi:hypothetical protein